MVDCRTMLSALVAAYDQHRRWMMADKFAPLQRAVDHARDVLNEPAAIESWHVPRALSDKALRLITSLPMDEIERRLLVPALRPIPVSERLPESSVKVLAHYFNDLGKGRTICAIWVPAKTRSDSYGDDDFTEYDEASDAFYWPEGWYEAIENWDDLGYIKVNEGEVLYWQPLPEWPAHALPLPEAS